MTKVIQFSDLKKSKLQSEHEQKLLENINSLLERSELKTELDVAHKDGKLTGVFIYVITDTQSPA